MLGITSSLYGNAYSQYGALSALGGVGQLSSLGSGSSVTALNRQESSYQVKLSAYGKLQSSLDTFKTALNNFKSAQDTAPFKATSATTATLTAKTSKGVTNSGSYDVSVSQLAKAQTLTSKTVADKDSTIVGTGSISIQIGAYNSTSNTFTPADSSGGKTVSISAGNGTLSGIANAINSAGAGVKASVVQVSGGYQLSLASEKSGTDNTIKLTTSDNDTTNGDLAGLSALAYDPTKGPSGYNKNLTEATAAQNAQLTVNGTSVTSQSNSVTSAVAGVTLDLTATGTSKVSVARDSEVFASSAQKFVDAYNALQKSVKELGTGYAAPLANDGLLARVGNDIGNTLSQASYGYGTSKLELSDIGITKQTDGTLALDKTRLQSAFAASPDNAATLLANTADKLSSTAARDTSSNSELQYTTRTLSKAVQSVQNRKALLQDYTSQTFYGLPAQPPLSSYISKFNSTQQAGRYAQVSSLF